MNLFELALHPDAFKERRGGFLVWWGNADNTSEDQFTFLNEDTCDSGHDIEIDEMDENVFRMYLLMVHWATLDSGDAA